MRSNAPILSAEEWNSLQVGDMVLIEYDHGPVPCLVNSKHRYTIGGTIYFKRHTVTGYQIMSHRIIKILKPHEKMKIMLTR